MFENGETCPRFPREVVQEIERVRENLWGKGGRGGFHLACDSIDPPGPNRGGEEEERDEPGDERVGREVMCWDEGE